MQTYTPDLTADNLEAERQRFAAWVVDLAAQCRNNAELVGKLTASLPADFIAQTGEGSTRRVYATRLGLAIKVQREDVVSDPLTEAELQARGGDSYLLQLGWRRRTANLSEMIFAANFPSLVPRHYGFLASFGIVQRHPSVIICETCRPLDYFFPNDGNGVKTEDTGIDAHGHLWIFDQRITSQKRPAHLLPFERFSGEGEPVIWLGNIGVLDGRYLLIDRSDHARVMILNEWNLSPKEWGLTLSSTIEQTLESSKSLLAKYQKAWTAANPEKGEPSWAKVIET